MSEKLIKYRFAVREFLNPDEHTLNSFVISHVEDTSKKDFDAKKVAKNMIDNEFTRPAYFDIPNPEITFKISDCNEIVELDFDFDGYDGEFPTEGDCYRKINVIVNALKQLELGIHEEARLYEKRKKEIVDEYNKLKKEQEDS